MELKIKIRDYLSEESNRIPINPFNHASFAPLILREFQRDFAYDSRYSTFFPVNRKASVRI